jgi:hypothetical protein
MIQTRPRAGQHRPGGPAGPGGTQAALTSTRPTGRGWCAVVWPGPRAPGPHWAGRAGLLLSGPARPRRRRHLRIHCSIQPTCSPSLSRIPGPGPRAAASEQTKQRGAQSSPLPVRAPVRKWPVGVGTRASLARSCITHTGPRRLSWPNMLRIWVYCPGPLWRSRVSWNDLLRVEICQAYSRVWTTG